REAAGRSADIERVAPGRIEAEGVEAVDQLERGARDISASRVLNRDVGVPFDLLAGLARKFAAHAHRTPQNRIAGARPRREKSAADEKLVEPAGAAVLGASVHGPSMANGIRKGKFARTPVNDPVAQSAWAGPLQACGCQSTATTKSGISSKEKPPRIAPMFCATILAAAAAMA